MTPQEKLDQSRRALQLHLLGRVPEPVVAQRDIEDTVVLLENMPATKNTRRQALMAEMDDTPSRAPSERARRLARQARAERASRERTDARGESNWMLHTAASALQAWWVRQPAYTAARLAEPALSAVAWRHPWRLVGAAALLGAGAVVFKPWRLLSVSALLASSIKPPTSQDLVGSLTAFMNSATQRRD